MFAVRSHIVARKGRQKVQQGSRNRPCGIECVIIRACENIKKYPRGIPYEIKQSAAEFYAVSQIKLPQNKRQKHGKPKENIPYYPVIKRKLG